MGLKKIVLCGCLATYCLIVNAQTVNVEKDVLFFEDSIDASIDTSKLALLTDVAKPSKDTLRVVTPKRRDTLSLSSKNDSIITIVRGYSPFSSYTDTFRVAASRDQNKANYYADLLLKRNKRKQFHLADSSQNTFIFDKDFAYTKTSLLKIWQNYITETRQAQIIASAAKTTETTSNTTETPTPSAAPDVDEKEIYTGQALDKADKPAPEKISQSLVTLTTDSISKNTELSYSNDTVEYFIQIAASRSPLSGQEIQQLTAEHENLRIIEEDNWHKYQLSAGTNYQQARAAINNYDSKNVFMVAYKGLRRLNLWETITHIRLQTPKQPKLIFVIQVAASRTPLTQREQAKLASETDRIRVVEEDGWYKYQIVTGPSYTLAIEKWKLVGTTRSFPVAYLDDKMIEMTEALKTIRINK